MEAYNKIFTRHHRGVPNGTSTNTPMGSCDTSPSPPTDNVPSTLASVNLQQSSTREYSANMWLLGDPALGNSTSDSAYSLMPPNQFEREQKNYCEDSSVLDNFSSADNGVEPDRTTTDFASRGSEKRATVAQTIVAIVRCFTGTALLFLPRAAHNGGLVLYICSMVASLIATIFGMRLLLRCCTAEEHNSYSGIAYRAFGRSGQILVDIAIVLSQLGFCAIYSIFIMSNIRDLNLLLHDCKLEWDINMWLLVLAQFLLYTPIVWIRRLKYFNPLLVLANILIISTLFIVVFFAILSLSERGVQSTHVFHNQQWPIMMGTIVYVWEGIGMILPIRASMKDHIQHKFPTILSFTIVGIALFAALYSALAYLAYGNDVNTIILFNLPKHWVSYTVQVMYSVGVCITYPFMMFPITNALESRLFRYATGVSLRRKWAKNCFRTLLVATALCLGMVGKTQLDNFSSLIGSVCCIPLAFIFPSLFFLKLVHNKTMTERVLCSLLLTVGCIGMIGTTYVAVVTWHASDVLVRCLMN